MTDNKTRRHYVALGYWCDFAVEFCPGFRGPGCLATKRDGERRRRQSQRDLKVRAISGHERRAPGAERRAGNGQ